MLLLVVFLNLRQKSRIWTPFHWKRKTTNLKPIHKLNYKIKSLPMVAIFKRLMMFSNMFDQRWPRVIMSMTMTRRTWCLIILLCHLNKEKRRRRRSKKNSRVIKSLNSRPLHARSVLSISTTKKPNKSMLRRRSILMQSSFTMLRQRQTKKIKLLSS